MANRLPRERHYLTRQQYAAAHSFDLGELNKVLEFAAEYGLEVVDTNPPARAVYLRATVAAIGSAFGVKLKLYRGTGAHASRIYRGRTGAIYVPVEIDGILTAVMGLDNRPQAHSFFRCRRRFGGAWAHAGAVSYRPDQVASQYGFPAGMTGIGESIGIVAFQGGYSPRDLEIHFERLGLDVPYITRVPVQGAGKSGGKPAAMPHIEVAACIQVAGAVAPGAHLIIYDASCTVEGLFRAVCRAIHDNENKPSVVSIGWGAAEAAWTPQSMHTFDLLFQTASSMGVTMCCAAGDFGSSNGIRGRLAHASFPASSPHVFACGGTTLNSSGDETVWNDGPGGGAGGGGISDFFPRPHWQGSAEAPQSINPGKHRGRGLPDGAANACPMTGYRIVFNEKDVVVGGTSVACSLWAGLIALLNQRLSCPVGFLNPLLYGRITKVQGAMRNITVGNNDLTGLVGGYQAGPGWNACAGWGTPNGDLIASALD
jgi:kumamolisin